MDATKTRDISDRAEVLRDWEDFLNKYMYICNSNEYHVTTNPKGFTNLGTAVNNMCLDIILPRITNPDIWTCDPQFLQYREGYGILELRKSLAAIMTIFFNTYEEVNPDNLFCVTGVTSCIDLISHCIADRNDVILAPTPIYSRIYTDMKQRSGVEMWPIPIIANDETDDYSQLTLEKVQNAYAEAISNNRVVRGIFIANPSNPLGDVYDPDLLMDILQFCKKNNLHAIVDEVYALSTFPSGEFHSVLKFPALPDEQHTHVLYGISKDFGIAGLRVGAIHTKCKVLQNCLKELSFFQTIPYPVMNITVRYLQDFDWLKKYITVNQKRIWDKYEYCLERLKNMGLTVRESKAGFFLWVNFGKVCNLKTFEEEKHFFEYLINQHVYIVPGKELFCAQPGWFRLTFTAYPDHVTEGLNRIEKALKDYKCIST